MNTPMSKLDMLAAFFAFVFGLSLALHASESTSIGFATSFILVLFADLRRAKKSMKYRLTGKHVY